jgi:peptidoglycan/LPS O-acetylase OafA/YrhL
VDFRPLGGSPHAGWGEADDASAKAGSPDKRRPRWVLRTLGFLGLALLSLVTALSLGHYTFGTSGSLLFGLIGAGYCSVKGFRTVVDHEVFRMLVPRRRPR